MKRTFLKPLGLGVILLCCTQFAVAQDTLRITLPEAEKIFTEKNLSLLAEKYNIQIASAQVIQAKLYSNPNLQLSSALYNPVAGKILDISDKTGQYSAAVQQLVLLAGKRNKQIQLAETGVSMASHKFFDLLRTLRFTLRSDFYTAFFLQRSINAYQAQVSSLEKLNSTYEGLSKRGVVTLKDATRIKSLLYSLKAEQNLLQTQLNDTESELRTLLQDNKTWYLLQSSADSIALQPLNGVSLQSLVDTAFANRYDLKLVQDNVNWGRQNLALQKAMATPDLTLGAGFDRRGSYVDNASFLNVAIDLPFFNRNQGNIKSAKISIDQGKLLLERQQKTVENDVQHAYLNASSTSKMLESIDPAFKGQFEQLLTSVTDNFQKQNLSLLELADFYDSYKENILQLNQLQNNRMQALEALNFAIGKTIFNY